MYVVFFEILAIFFNLFILYYIISQMGKGHRHNIYIIYLVFFIFFILPLVLDLIIGIPNYYRYPGFYISANDVSTRIIYVVYSILTPIIMLKIGISKKNIPKPLNTSIIYKYRIILYFIIFLPIILVILSPDRLIYINYAAATKRLLSVEGVQFHTYIALFSRISVICIALLLYIKKKNTLITLWLFTPIIFFDIWVFGKRSIVALAFASILFIVWKKKLFSNTLIIISCIMASIFILVFSLNYQNNVRSFEGKEFSETYLNYRIDYGRDDVTRMTIYNEINKESSILEYRGQSMLFYLTIYIPREIWPEKPYPYAQYVTSALFLTEPKLWGWGMTTSILEEAIANFGWLGFILGPASIAYIVRKGDTSNNEALTLISLVLAILLMVVHLTPIFPFFLIWLFLLFFERNKNKKSALSSFK